LRYRLPPSRGRLFGDERTDADTHDDSTPSSCIRSPSHHEQGNGPDPPTPTRLMSWAYWPHRHTPGTPRARRRHGTPRTRVGGEGGWLAELAAHVLDMGTLTPPYARHFSTFVPPTHKASVELSELSALDESVGQVVGWRHITETGRHHAFC
jgi:hypothetical protein